MSLANDEKNAEAAAAPLRAAALLVLGGVFLVAALVTWQQNPVLSVAFLLLTAQAVLTERNLWFTASRPGYAVSPARQRARWTVYALTPVIIATIVVSFFL